MKLVKTASGKSKIKLSKKEWQDIGKKAGWMKKAGGIEEILYEENYDVGSAHEYLWYIINDNNIDLDYKNPALTEEHLQNCKQLMNSDYYLPFFRKLIGFRLNVINSFLKTQEQEYHKNREWETEDKYLGRGY